MAKTQLNFLSQLHIFAVTFINNQIPNLPIKVLTPSCYDICIKLFDTNS
jgi:hypothetical protein